MLRRIPARFLLVLLPLIAALMPTAKAQLLEVKELYAPIYEGNREIAYVKKGTHLNASRVEKGYYLVEVTLEGADGENSVLGWVPGEYVRMVPYSKSYNPEHGRNVPAAKAKADIEELIIEDGDVRRREIAPDDVPEDALAFKGKTKYDSVAGDEGKAVARKPGADLDLSNLEVVAPDKKTEDPLVSDEPLPYIKEQGEKTLGRGTKDMGITMENVIAVIAVFGVIAGAFFWISKEADRQQQRKKGGRGSLEA